MRDYTSALAAPDAAASILRCMSFIITANPSVSQLCCCLVSAGRTGPLPPDDVCSTYPLSATSSAFTLHLARRLGMPALTKGKGKARADPPSETSPLLAEPSGSGPRSEQAESPRPSRLRSILLTAGIVFFSLILSALLFIILLAASYRPAPSQLESLPRTAFKYAPPDSISVLKLDDDGILLNVSLRCGIDVDRALGIRPDDTDREQGAAWWEALRRWTAYRVLPHLPSTVNVKLPAPLIASLHSNASISLRVLDNMPIPMISGADSADGWMKPISFLVLSKPETASVEWWDLAKRIWADGYASVSVSVPSAIATYPLPWFSRNVSVEKEDLVLGFDVPCE